MRSALLWIVWGTGGCGVLARGKHSTCLPGTRSLARIKSPSSFSEILTTVPYKPSQTISQHPLTEGHSYHKSGNTQKLSTEVRQTPSALTSCLGQLFERVILNRLQSYMESNDNFPHTMFGFRLHPSTQAILLQLEDDDLNHVSQPNLRQYWLWI